MKKKIILVFGDPNSINSEIIFKTWKKISTSLKKNIYIIGNFELIETRSISAGIQTFDLSTDYIFHEFHFKNI